jgi:hypothetical protein
LAATALHGFNHTHTGLFLGFSLDYFNSFGSCCDGFGSFLPVSPFWPFLIMTFPNNRLSSLFFVLCFCAPLVSPRTAFAQSVFVSLGIQTNKKSVQTIPVPGYGWNYSAAAAVPGETWNQISRPEPIDVTAPAVRTGGQAGTGRQGVFPLGDPAGVALVDSANQPTTVRLNITMKVENLSTDKPRAEPSFYNKSKGAIPEGLMNTAWRVYHSENSLGFTLSGLKPGKPYQLYIYAATFDAGSTNNPTGEGSGARFNLAAGNVVEGHVGVGETAGGFLASLYTFDPETNKIALAPEGTTWIKLSAHADASGSITFNTQANAKRLQMINGFQLVDVTP